MAFTVECHEELEADLLPEHDLLDVWRGNLSWRRLELLIRHLPQGGATVRKIAPDVAAMADWTHEAEVAATHFDAYMQVHFKSPKPYPRPATVAAERRRTEARHAALELQAQRTNNSTTGGR